MEGGRAPVENCASAVNEKAALNFCKSVEVMNIDAGPDEVLAAKLGRKRTPHEEHPLTPNLKFIVRDRAHGARRVLERGWGSDPYLKETIEFLVRDSSSMTQRIENSHLFKAWFKMSQPHAKVKIDASVANLRAAKHRFESYIKPLARLVLFVEAFTATAIRIVAERGNEPAAQDAKTFLCQVTSERLLQAAMMADAADEAGHLIRSCESEDWDIARMSLIIDTFKTRINYLFNNNGARTGTTFTQFMLKFLSVQHSWIVGGAHFGVGFARGVPEHIIRRCFGRMRCWIPVAESVLDAEFPNFDVFSAFVIFNLPDTVDPKAVPGVSNDLNIYFRRLAQSFGVNVHGLMAQHYDHVHMAVRLKVTECLSNVAAWCKSVRHSQRRKEVREARPADALIPVLKRYRAYAISTGGVERTFGKSTFVWNADHQDMTIKMKLLWDFREPEKEDIIKRAQVIYCNTWTAPRSSPKLFLQVGRPKKKKTGGLAYLDTSTSNKFDPR